MLPGQWPGRAKRVVQTEPVILFHKSPTEDCCNQEESAELLDGAFSLPVGFRMVTQRQADCDPQAFE